MALAPEFIAAAPFVVAAYLDLRRLTLQSIRRVGTLEHCHIKCKPNDSNLFSGEKTA